MLEINQPHDSLFKAAFGKKVVTKDFLLNRLPADILAQIDIKTLKRENNSFIDEQLRPYYSDVVFKVKTQKGEESYLYFLLEQQTKPDIIMPLRLLEYDVAIMRYDVEQQLKMHKSKQEKEKPISLPAIFNFVVYTGKKEWKYPTRLIDAFSAPELLYRMFEENFCIRLNKESEDKIMKDGQASAAELFLREGWRKDFCNFLVKNDQIIKLINKSHYGKAVILYILNRDPHNVSDVLKKLPNLDAELKTQVMTALQKLKQEGIWEGRKEGIQEGRKEGIWEGRKEGIQEGIEKGLKLVAKKMMAEGDSLEKVSKVTELTVSQLKKLKTKHIQLPKK